MSTTYGETRSSPTRIVGNPSAYTPFKEFQYTSRPTLKASYEKTKDIKRLLSRLRLLRKTQSKQKQKHNTTSVVEN